MIKEMKISIQQIQKAECFASIFQHLKAFTENINIMFEKDRMYMQTMDSARVSIIEIALPNTWFDVYEHTSPTTITLGINSTILYKILNSREKTQSINIVYNEGEGDHLAIYFTSENKDEFDKRFEVPLMDIEMDILGIPEIEHQAEFTVSSYHFSTIVNQLQMFGDTMDISCTEEKIILASHSQDHGKMFVEIKIDDLSSFIIDENGSIDLSFSLNYLHNICLYNKIAKEIELKIAANYPIQIIYDLGSVVNAEKAEIKFYLAPKINDNDD
jgi:proliferating cell nuclear antigen